MKTLSFDEYQKLCEQPLKVPIFIQLVSDLLSPIRVFYALKKIYKRGFLLESREHVEDVGKYSFIGFNPKMSLEVKDQKTFLIRKGERQVLKGDFNSILRKILQQHKIVGHPLLPPLAGGAVGFMSYDAIRLFEEIPSRHEDKEKLPDFYFGFYETVIVFDHLYQTMTLIYIPERKGDLKDQYQKGINHLNELMSYIISFSQDLLIKVEAKNVGDTKLETDCDDASFEEIVKNCKEYIKAGDILQVVPSRTFYQQFKGDPIDIFRVLRILNPSPFMFYLDNEDYVITGSSLERFASYNHPFIETLLIGGGLPRGKGDQDKIYEKKLLSDEKEIAQHMMFVDLARNDIGSISMPKSVEVKDLMSIQRLSHVMHMTTRVMGRIRPKLDALDVLKAFLPTGNLLGAPKIRAMEIIDKVEKSRRGIYGGCIFYIDNLGNLDSCAAIQMTYIQNGIAKVRAGAGVVFDSQPEKEAIKTMRKARVIIEAISRVQRGEI